MGLFIAGLVVSIPLSIIANIYTPKVQNWLAGRSTTRLTRRVRELRSELDTISHYRDNRSSLNELLLGVILRTTYVGSIGGILAGALFIMGRTLSDAPIGSIYIPNIYTEFTFNDIVTVLGQLTTVLTALIIVRLCSNGLKTLNRVQNFDSYQEAAQSALDRLESGKLRPAS
jgi:hypothetical protein